MLAIILAAGKGTRLSPYTDEFPKPLVPIFGQPLITQQIENLRIAGIQRIDFITGYKAEKFCYFDNYCWHNAEYGHTNMVYSLMKCFELFNGQQDIIVSYGDILVNSPIIQQLIATEGDIVVSSDNHWHQYWSLRMNNIQDDAETFKVDINGNLLSLGEPIKQLSDVNGQFIGLIKISNDVQQKFVELYLEILDRDPVYARSMYMTDFITAIIGIGVNVSVSSHHRGWLEIDTVKDKETYEKIFREGDLSTLGYQPITDGQS